MFSDSFVFISLAPEPKATSNAFAALEDVQEE